MTEKIDVRKELQRRKSHYTRIVELFQREGTVTNLDLGKITYRYSARIGEARKDGHIIVARYEKPGIFAYTYLGQRSDSK